MFHLNKKFRILKMAAISAIVTSSLLLANGSNTFADSSNLTTIHYVYLNNTYIGTVSDQSIIEKSISEKIKDLKKTYKDLDLKINPQIEYISEEVFHSTANDQETISNLENSNLLQADSAVILVEGTPVAYLDSTKAAKNVIEKLKLQYVSKDQLKKLEKKKASRKASLSPLKQNETRLLDVHFAENVSIHAEKAAPEKVLTAKKAVTFLQKGNVEEKKYEVKKGDVLGSIANDHKLKLEDLLALNPKLQDDSVLKIGQRVDITVPKPYINVVVEKEINKKETIPYKSEVVTSSSLPKGETKERQKGKKGSRAVTYQILLKNGKPLKKAVIEQKVLQKPVKHIVVKGTKVIPSRGEGSFAWPTVGGYISSKVGYRWGRMHKGIDIARPSNRTIKAADNGVVIFAGIDGSFGNKIEIDHRNGFHTIYAHMSSLKVSAGQTIEKGQAIGIMGATGDATGVHLHFEVYKNGALENPLSYLRR
ncbi:M23 family metallopeptidase [Bacillus salipaludis]|uniref:M23 family metallopeptidase n=1 Tax=Bacillus salipaludis TaxID=2547811 RepID=A0AA90TQU6_9BACI|nr:M23 family metallopeptidase [Bacillus salipaludis]MDQ6595320.1 M23 family metallopeptidase [Bacillus salipaludis]